MGKDKESKIEGKIKTARYFTKTCSNCKFEYPNWFTNCPQCHQAWDEAKAQAEALIEQNKKDVKILAKIPIEGFSESIHRVNLIFSGDRGQTWYRIQMNYRDDYYLGEIAEVPIGSLILYYIEVVLENGEKIIENNEGNFFLYRVGTVYEEREEKTSTSEAERIQEGIDSAEKPPQDYFVPKEESQIDQNPIFPSPNFNPSAEYNDNSGKKTVILPERSYQKEQGSEVTIFGKPQTELDPDLKICPHCGSKIKSFWSTCPICGVRID
ncbi:MAG: hypothetical protein P8Y70_03575 [Candidatus Lokiarchaeota archaeon]